MRQITGLSQGTEICPGSHAADGRRESFPRAGHAPLTQHVVLDDGTDVLKRGVACRNSFRDFKEIECLVVLVDFGQGARGPGEGKAAGRIAAQ